MYDLQEEQEEQEQEEFNRYIVTAGRGSLKDPLDSYELVKREVSHIKLNEVESLCKFKDYMILIDWIHVQDYLTGTQCLMRVDKNKTSEYRFRHLSVRVMHDCNGAVAADLEYRKKIL